MSFRQAPSFLAKSPGQPVAFLSLREDWRVAMGWARWTAQAAFFSGFFSLRH
jgi:hypothetical protein